MPIIKLVKKSYHAIIELINNKIEKFYIFSKKKSPRRSFDKYFLTNFFCCGKSFETQYSKGFEANCSIYNIQRTIIESKSQLNIYYCCKTIKYLQYSKNNN